MLGHGSSQAQRFSLSISESTVTPTFWTFLTGVTEDIISIEPRLTKLTTLTFQLSNSYSDFVDLLETSVDLTWLGKQASHII